LRYQTTDLSTPAPDTRVHGRSGWLARRQANPDYFTQAPPHRSNRVDPVSRGDESPGQRPSSGSRSTRCRSP
jgi:hypothetical protein